MLYVWHYLNVMKLNMTSSYICWSVTGQRVARNHCWPHSKYCTMPLRWQNCLWVTCERDELGSDEFPPGCVRCCSLIDGIFQLSEDQKIASQIEQMELSQRRVSYLPLQCVVFCVCVCIHASQHVCWCVCLTYMHICIYQCVFACTLARTCIFLCAGLDMSDCMFYMLCVSTVYVCVGRGVDVEMGHA